jgi:hypothetical protein
MGFNSRLDVMGVFDDRYLFILFISLAPTFFNISARINEGY